MSQPSCDEQEGFERFRRRYAELRGEEPPEVTTPTNGTEAANDGREPAGPQGCGTTRRATEPAGTRPAEQVIPEAPSSEGAATGAAPGPVSAPLLGEPDPAQAPPHEPAGGTPCEEAGEQHPGADFFDRNTELGAEIIEGTIREGQLVVFGGPYCVGKTPFLTDLAVHVLNGREWNGRAVQQRPVIVFDFESPGAAYKRNVKNIAARLKVRVPEVPDELAVYLEHDLSTEPATARLLEVLKSNKLKDRLDLLEEALRRKPNALVIIDPLEMLFRIDTGKKTNVLCLYNELKLLLARYPHAALSFTVNMRKQDPHRGLPDLLSNPRGFLEEVCGTLDIHNRSDVRLGMDEYGEDTRVINGVRRGEEFHPLLVRPVGEPPENLAGFELVPPNDTDLVSALTSGQLKYWKDLATEFSFEAVADKTVPRSSLSRLIRRAQSLGLLVYDEKSGRYRKVVTPR